MPGNERVYRRYIEIFTSRNLSAPPEVVDVERYQEECAGVTPGPTASIVPATSPPKDERQRCRKRVQRTAAAGNIGEIDRCCGHPNQHLPRPWGRVGKVNHHQHLRCTLLNNLNCSHVNPCQSSARDPRALPRRRAEWTSEDIPGEAT